MTRRATVAAFVNLFVETAVRWAGAAVRSGAARFDPTVCLTCRYGVAQNLCRIPIDADSCWREFDGEL